jgi:hypothetical protein
MVAPNSTNSNKNLGQVEATNSYGKRNEYEILIALVFDFL